MLRETDVEYRQNELNMTKMTRAFVYVAAAASAKAGLIRHAEQRVHGTKLSRYTLGTLV